MEKTKVHNLIIIDASGSMSAIYQAALMGLNETIDTIQQAKEAAPGVEQRVSLLSFNSGGIPLHYVYDNVGADEAHHLGEKDYMTRGNTALYDAIGESASRLESQVAEGEKVLVTIITDGMENSSKEWTRNSVKALVERLSQKGWVFTYIGANQSAEEVSASMSIKNSMNWNSTLEGTAQMFRQEAKSRAQFYMNLEAGHPDIDKDFFKE